MIRLKVFKVIFIVALAAIAVSGLTACGSGLVGDTPDGYFQVQGTAKGSVCVDGFYPLPQAGEDKIALEHIWKYYEGVGERRVTYSDQGLGATCGNSYKPKADLVITREFYENTIVPATPL
jgi:hypothetical protein